MGRCGKCTPSAEVLEHPVIRREEAMRKEEYMIESYRQSWGLIFSGALDKPPRKEGDKYLCPQCGTEVKPRYTEFGGPPGTNYYGDEFKCPSCGWEGWIVHGIW